MVEGRWKDTGRLEDLPEASRMALDTVTRWIEGKMDEASRIEVKAVVGVGTEIAGSIVRGPAIIGRDVRIRAAWQRGL